MSTMYFNVRTSDTIVVPRLYFETSSIVTKTIYIRIVELSAYSITTSKFIWVYRENLP